jgi:hypothetical protein
MTKDEALKLALKALETAEIDGNCEYGATEIIRKALAQPEHIGFMDSKLNPIQRTWVGLTKMELIKCGVLPYGMTYKLYEAIEAKLKEKNT